MAKKVSSHIYELIYSLSSSERRYFKLYVSKNIGKENQLSLKLFDLIARSEGREVSKIEKKITFTEHPSRLKNYLYDLILKSLEGYHVNSSINLKIRTLINQLELLYDKALYEQCVSLAKKGVDLSEKIDNQAFKIELYNWYLLAAQQIEQKSSSRLITSLFKKRQQAIAILKLENDYAKLNYKTYNILKQKGTFKSKLLENSMKEAIDDPLLSNGSLALSFSSKIYFNNTFYNYYRVFPDVEKLKFYGKQNLLLYEESPEIQTIDQFNYLYCMKDYAINCMGVQEYEKALFYFDKMDNVSPKTLQIEIKQFEFVCANKLDLLVKTGAIKEGLEMVERIEKGFQKYEGKINDLFKTVLYVNLSHLFFVSGEFKKALRYNNLILDEENTFYRQDIYRYAKLLNLLLHYEINSKNVASLEYFYNAIFRDIKNKSDIYDSERWFFKFYKKLINLDKLSHRDFFFKEEQTLLQLLHTDKNADIIEHYNVLAWLRSKHSSISFQQAMVEYSQCEFDDYVLNRRSE